MSVVMSLRGSRTEEGWEVRRGEADSMRYGVIIKCVLAISIKHAAQQRQQMDESDSEDPVSMSMSCHGMAGRPIHAVQRHSGGSGWGLRNGSLITGINASGMPPGKHIPARPGRERQRRPQAAGGGQDHGGLASRRAAPECTAWGRIGWQDPSQPPMRTGHGGRPWLCPVWPRRRAMPGRRTAPNRPITSRRQAAVIPGRAPFRWHSHGECLFAERSVARMTHCRHCRSEMSQAPVRRWCHCAATAQRSCDGNPIPWRSPTQGAAAICHRLPAPAAAS